MIFCFVYCVFFFFNDTATTEIYTLSLHDALPISRRGCGATLPPRWRCRRRARRRRSEEHTSELQSRFDLVCRLLLEKKKKMTSRRAPRSINCSHPLIPINTYST